MRARAFVSVVTAMSQIGRLVSRCSASGSSLRPFDDRRLVRIEGVVEHLAGGVAVLLGADGHGLRAPASAIRAPAGRRLRFRRWSVAWRSVSLGTYIKLGRGRRCPPPVRYAGRAARSTTSKRVAAQVIGSRCRHWAMSVSRFSPNSTTRSTARAPSGRSCVARSGVGSWPGSWCRPGGAGCRASPSPYRVAPRGADRLLHVAAPGFGGGENPDLLGRIAQKHRQAPGNPCSRSPACCRAASRRAARAAARSAVSRWRGAGGPQPLHRRLAGGFRRVQQDAHRRNQDGVEIVCRRPVENMVGRDGCERRVDAPERGEKIDDEVGSHAGRTAPGRGRSSRRRIAGQGRDQRPRARRWRAPGSIADKRANRLAQAPSADSRGSFDQAAASAEARSGGNTPRAAAIAAQSPMSKPRRPASAVRKASSRGVSSSRTSRSRNRPA